MFELPSAAYEARFVHASGPGGQHVNKASTAVELRVYLNKLELPPGALHRLKQQNRNRINKDGVLIIQADQHRSQLQNRKAAVARVESMVATALRPPKRRVATRPTLASKKKRLQHKKQRSVTKTNRKKPNIE